MVLFYGVMKYTHFIVAVLMSLFSVLSARAETACETLNSVLSTVSVVRDIQADSQDIIRDIYVSELNNRVDNIVLPSLIPMKQRDEFLPESTAILQYISVLREAVTGAQGGYQAYAKETINQAMSAEFLQSLDSLDNYWGCNASSNDNLMGEAPDIDTAIYFGAGQDAASPTEAGIEHSALSTSQERGDFSNGEAISQVTFSPVRVRQTSIVIFIALGTMMLIGSFYVYVSRRKTFEARELRRVLRLPVRVRSENTERAVLIVDISMNGAKIKHSKTIKEKSTLQIYLGDEWHRGQVRWSNDHYAGVMFKVPIKAEAFKVITQNAEAYVKQDESFDGLQAHP